MNKAATATPWWKIYCLLAGGGDAATGILLMVFPLFTLGLMGIDPPSSDPVFLRFIGAFVAGVGLCYGLPFLGREGASRKERLFAIFDATALVRFCVAGLLTVALLTGDLVPAWWTVAATDLALGSFQVYARRYLPFPATTTASGS